VAQQPRDPRRIGVERDARRAGRVQAGEEDGRRGRRPRIAVEVERDRPVRPDDGERRAAVAPGGHGRAHPRQGRDHVGERGVVRPVPGQDDGRRVRRGEAEQKGHQHAVVAGVEGRRGLRQGAEAGAGDPRAVPGALDARAEGRRRCQQPVGARPGRQAVDDRDAGRGRREEDGDPRHGPVPGDADVADERGGGGGGSHRHGVRVRGAGRPAVLPCVALARKPAGPGRRSQVCF
jgi:hypothetical protein